MSTDTPGLEPADPAAETGSSEALSARRVDSAQSADNDNDPMVRSEVLAETMLSTNGMGVSEDRRRDLVGALQCSVIDLYWEAMLALMSPTSRDDAHDNLNAILRLSHMSDDAVAALYTTWGEEQ